MGLGGCRVWDVCQFRVLGLGLRTSSLGNWVVGLSA